MNDKDLLVRPAEADDMIDIYKMGFDVWSDGDEAKYLESCVASKKYKRGKWYVLEDKFDLLSSAIVYDFKNSFFGVGSVATKPSARTKGFGSFIVERMTTEIMNLPGFRALFLFSDIGTKFYEKLGYVVLPERFQKYPDSKLMVYSGLNLETLLIESESFPDYF